MNVTRLAATAMMLAGASALHAGAPPVSPSSLAPVVEAGTIEPPVAKPVADPAVVVRTLPNGMRYALMPNSGPPGAVSIRLAFRVGSYEEADDERGFAHFLEHMAFRSTRNAPNGVMDNRFASFGVTLGQDQNAFTMLDATVYRVDLPAGEQDGIRQVLAWLRDTADGVVFTPAAVDAERNVLAAELRARMTPLARVQRQTATFLTPELRSTVRDPGGTPESLSAARPEALQAFYRRWYRPENAMLVVTGDIDPAAVARLAEQSFSSWTASGPAPQRPARPKALNPRPLEAISLVDPSLPASIAACRAALPDVERAPSPERLRKEMLSALWLRIFNARLSRLAAAGGASFLGAGAVVARDGPDSRMTCIFTAPADGRWQDSLASVQAELQRFVKDGPTELEVKDAVNNAVVTAWSAARQAATRQTPDLADAIVGADLSGRTFETPMGAADTAEALTAGVTPATVKDAFAADWSGTGPLIAATTPAAIAEEALVAAWTANAAAKPLDVYADHQAAVWNYSNFGRTGKVKKRVPFPDPGFVRLVYGNGVILNFKHTDFASGTAEVRVRFGHGERAFTAQTRQPIGFGAGMVASGGLGKLSAAEITEALGTGSWTFDLIPETTSWVMSGSAFASDMLREMQVLAAFVTDPGFRPLIDEKMPTVVDMGYRLMRADPAAVANDAFEEALFPEQRSFPPREDLLKWRSADIAQVLKPVLASAPIEITIVGDIAEDSARQAVAATFGALPKRASLPVPSGPGPFRRFPARLPAPVTGYHEGGADKAAALLVWPLYVANVARRDEEYAINLAAAIFRDRLMQRARIQMGKTYSPSVDTQTPDDADQGFLAASFETTPQDLDALVAAAGEIAQDLAVGSITQDELDRARLPMLADRQQALTRNEAWASILSLSYRYPEAIDELVRYRDQMQALTLADVKRAAATWLRQEPMIARALPDPKRFATERSAPAGPAGAFEKH
ncbi:M16 family metallopeptidase [Allosphingosinicella deserti]|uniref:Peptidase M16 n=1 Tax=Allosphingosinicella deserti TaxID=2116704 RepID=A0A2P7QEG1_9SPHN|nr:insulinase family protein [Sphingomonas deserti]PSJ36349.1 hypothetical protein C7I55_26235 [Sphingomonas deserti]